MNHRYIVVPEPAPFLEIDGVTPTKNSETGRDEFCTFQRFVEGRTTDPAYTENGNWPMSAIVSGESVRAAFRGKAPGELVELDEDDWLKLKRSTENGSYHQVAAASVISFMRIIVDAKSTKPTIAQ